MFAGKPLLVSDCRSVGRIVEEERCGCVYRSDSPEDFAFTLRKLIEMPEEWKRMGSRGHDAVIKKYNLRTEASKLLASYDGLVGGSR